LSLVIKKDDGIIKRQVNKQLKGV